MCENYDVRDKGTVAREVLSEIQLQILSTNRRVLVVSRRETVLL